ncbi:hypothetical protein [Sodalis glossinidius]|uniref:hypothetical protein n=1 Tax=Sodalis glossinidius TaxID=63612 RepID=UPI0011D0EEDD|nr:hypothetical protein [Sodalis glossinidius]
MKMMDHSRAEHRRHYRIAWKNNGYYVYILTLIYAGKSITRTMLNQQEIDFLKEKLFNENNGEIILRAARSESKPHHEHYARSFLRHYEDYKQQRATAITSPLLTAFWDKSWANPLINTSSPKGRRLGGDAMGRPLKLARLW